MSYGSEGVVLEQNDWVDEQDATIGKVFEVVLVNIYGVLLDCGRNEEYYFPPCCLKVIK